jgi:hypothetical protein
MEHQWVISGGVVSLTNDDESTYIHGYQLEMVFLNAS